MLGLRTVEAPTCRSLATYYILPTMPRRRAKGPRKHLTDSEVRAVLVQAMADVGAAPAFIYAFQKTGVYICEENERRLPTSSLKAFDGARDEFFAALKRQPQ